MWLRRAWDGREGVAQPSVKWTGVRELPFQGWCIYAQNKPDSLAIEPRTLGLPRVTGSLESAERRDG